MQVITDNTDGTRIALNLSQVLMVLDRVQFRTVVFAMGPSMPRLGEEDAGLDVDAAIDDFELPGMFVTRLVDEYGKCSPVVVNRANVAYAEACAEGTRLYPAKARPFVVEAGFATWIVGGE